MRQGIYLAEDDYTRVNKSDASYPIIVVEREGSLRAWWFIDRTDHTSFLRVPFSAPWSLDEKEERRIDFHRLALPIEFMETKGD
jgi:hypothetical protein